MEIRFVFFFWALWRFSFLGEGYFLFLFLWRARDGRWALVVGFDGGCQGVYVFLWRSLLEPIPCGLFLYT